MLPASTSFNNLIIVEVSLDNIAYWRIVSEVRAKSSVFIPDQYITVAIVIPEMADIGLDSTLTSLVLLGKATYGLPPISTCIYFTRHYRRISGRCERPHRQWR